MSSLLASFSLLFLYTICSTIYMENNRRKSIENICSVLLLHFAIINARKKPFVYVYLKEIHSPRRARINKNKNTEDILIAVHVATLLAQTRKHSLICIFRAQN